MKEITMPKLSDTMAEGTVVVWRKAVGSTVERGEVIAEVETDKATMELEAYASGVLSEIRVAAGTTVPVGTVIGVIGAAGEQPAAANFSPTQPAVSQPPPEPPPAPPSEPGPAPVPLQPAAGEVLAAPVVRRRAQELGVDLAVVTGSGPGGRILLEDLETTAPAEPPPAALQPQASPGEVAPVPAAAQPLSRMRMAIARTVTESWRTIPHFSVTVEVRMDAAERMREEFKNSGHAVSLTALLTRATAQALAEFPLLNASLQEERLVVHAEINIGIVVRRDEGLLVPILHDCASLALAETARRVSSLVERARQGQMSHTELSGGTFAISNLGMYGSHSFVALILPPMVAVLAVGAVRDAVVIESGRPGVGRVLSLTLSADHRVVDGAYAAEFLQRVKSLLEQPRLLAG